MQARTRRNWIAVASAEHARLGRDHQPIGFMQVGHGKGAPLKHLNAGDRVAYVDDRQRWGSEFRFGLFEVAEADMHRVATAMAADRGMLYFS